MMQGISTLPGAQQNPGQAAPLQALPPQQPKTPAETINTLNSQLSEDPEIRLQQARALYAQNPTLTTLGLVSKAFKAYNLAQKEKNQEALAAYQQQGPQTVADQLFQQTGAVAQPLPQHTQYARHGGVMHSYADGGLTLGYDRDYMDARRFGIPLSPYNSAEERARNLQQLKTMREFEVQRSQGQAEIPSEAGEELKRGIASAYSDTSRRRDVPPPASPTGVTAVAPPTMRQSMAPARPAGVPAGAPARAGIAAGVQPSDTSLGGIAQLVGDQTRRLEAAKILPPELVAAQKRMAELEAANVAAQRESTGAYGKESLEALEAARARAGRSRLDDIEFLGRMLEGSRGAKTFGEALAGAGSGAGRAEGERRAALQQAEKERRADMRMIRAEEAAGRQLELLAAQRQMAEMKGDVARVAEIDDKITAVKMNLENLKISRADVAFKQGIDLRNIAAEEMKARAQMIGATARGAEKPNDARRVFDTIMDNVQKEYDKWATSAEGAKTALKPELAKAKRMELLEQQVRLAKAAGVQGLDPLLEAVKAGSPSTTPAGRTFDFVTGKPIN